ncbi:hypothetical protein T484DRAFT_1877406 [Baffinella frigidus]|nr:hypothetical protein T484DRAFT_1877406 [Cryptophyta sp. CCMP2293]
MMSFCKEEKAVSNSKAERNCARGRPLVLEIDSTLSEAQNVHIIIKKVATWFANTDELSRSGAPSSKVEEVKMRKTSSDEKGHGLVPVQTVWCREWRI